MNVNIPHIEHRVYKTTFLERVGITIKFKEEDSNAFQIYRSFFNDFFGLTLEKDIFEMMMLKHLMVKSSPNAFNYKFSKGYIRLIVEGGVYKSFEETIVPCLKKLVELVSALKASIISLEIRKINMWPQEDLRANNVKQHMEAVFSDDLMKDFEQRLDTGDDDVAFFTKSIQQEGIDMVLLVTIGAITDNEEVRENRIVLDTEAISQQVACLTAPQVMTTALEMNAGLFDLFHWCVKGDVIKSMSVENKVEVHEI